MMGEIIDRLIASARNSNPWRSGRFDWRQAADIVTPGNWWDSQQQRVDGYGLADGIGRMAGVPVPVGSVAREIGPAFRRVSAGTGAILSRLGVGGADVSRINAIQAARRAGVPRINSIRDAQAAGELADAERSDPRISGADAPRGTGGQSQARANLLGASQRFGSQLDFNEMYAAQRRQSQQER